MMSAFDSATMATTSSVRAATINAERFIANYLRFEDASPLLSTLHDLL
jgi:hypothetical protein